MMNRNEVVVYIRKFVITRTRACLGGLKAMRARDVQRDLRIPLKIVAKEERLDIRRGKSIRIWRALGRQLADRQSLVAPILGRRALGYTELSQPGSI